MPSIVLDDVKKTFPAAEGQATAAVDGVSLTVTDRELLALVGPAGSGKTTLLRLIAGAIAHEIGHTPGRQRVMEVTLKKAL